MTDRIDVLGLETSAATCCVRGCDQLAVTFGGYCIKHHPKPETSAALAHGGRIMTLRECIEAEEPPADTCEHSFQDIATCAHCGHQL